MMKGLVAFWTLFSAISIVVMVLTALAQIHPVPSGEGVLPRQRPVRQEMVQRNPEGEERVEGADRIDSGRAARGSGRDGAAPAGKTGRG